mgnify:CR=1 FL=1
MKNGYNIAVLGATGVVGRQMIDALEEYKIPVAKLVLLASASSEGKKIPFNGKEITVKKADENSFKGMDFVLGAVENAQAKYFAPHIVKSGAVFIDNSSAFRMDDGVPLVIPEINGEDAKTNSGIISNPNCSTIITLMAIAGLATLSPVKSIIASTYQAVSGAGKKGLEELESQIAALSEGEKPVYSTFPHQIAMNVIPFIGKDTGNAYTSEEMKLQNESRKILHLPALKASCTCVRVPVMRSHSISVAVRFERKITVSEAQKAIRDFPGCRLIEDYEGRCYPTPLDTSNQDLVWVGRIREDLTDENGLLLWCCGDQVRKGAAVNAVQILQLLI